MHDTELWEAFSTSTLPASEWTHRGHLRVAWLFAKRYPFNEAHLLLRVGIIRLNAFHGLVETTARGYHETLTRAWLAIVAGLAKTTDAPTSDAFVDACADQLDRDAIFRHYSRERVFGLEARSVFVEPDRAPFA